MIRLIAAIDQHRGLASRGLQPWHIPQDQHYFEQQTMLYGRTVLMGLRTFEVIGHPLKDRHTIVVSHRQHQPAAGLIYIDDLESFLANSKQDVWVIGGAAIYEQTLRRADELYLTIINANFSCDLFFPSFEPYFKLKHQSRPQTDNGYTFNYCVYSRL